MRTVRAKSPASSAGLTAQDIITQVDGKPVVSMGGLIVALRSHRPGDLVTIGYVRNNTFHMVPVKLVARPKNL